MIGILRVAAVATTTLAVHFCSHALAQEVSDDTYLVLSKIYEARFEAGDPQGAYDLGFLYNSGLGVSKNLPLAFEWYLKAARSGHAPSQEKVAMFYLVGVGTVKSDFDAYVWTLLANYHGVNHLSSQIIRLEAALALDARAAAQAKARKCVEVSLAEC